MAQVITEHLAPISRVGVGDDKSGFTSLQGWLRAQCKTTRSKLCSICFMKKSRSNGTRSARNAHSKGTAGNACNTTTGMTKSRAGRRSGMRRSAKKVFVVKKRWLDFILDGPKDWKIRGCSTHTRGWIHFAESKAGGKIVGRARLVDCVPVPRSDFMEHFDRHRVSSLSKVPYKHIFAWVLKDAERFPTPLLYAHRSGAVIWVKV